jgi:diguanylate cyclase (GGDEF)-like protein/PAS domain S-box-containing protein
VESETAGSLALNTDDLGAGSSLSANQLSAVFDLLPDAIFALDSEMRVVFANREALRFLGVELEDWRGRIPLDLIHPDDVAITVSSFEEVKRKDVGTPIELRLRAADGEWRLTEVIGSTFVCADGMLQLNTFRDLTQRRRWEVAAARPERFRSVVEHAATVLMLLDETGTIDSVSGAMSRQLGHDPTRVVGSRLVEWAVPEQRAQLESTLRSATEHKGVTTTEANLSHKDGRSIPYQLSVVNAFDDPVVGGLIVSGHDITSRRELEERLAYLANHDPLTGLANRGHLVAHLEACRRATTDPERLGVVFIDLDRFKPVNDLYGHDAGDQLLVLIGARIRAAVRPEDLVARLGGDEFVVVCPDLGATGTLAAIAERIEAAVADPVKIGGVAIKVAASVGIVTSAGATSADALVAEADEAMYVVKRARRGQFATTRLRLGERRELAEHLSAALAGAPADAGLAVHFQPIVAIPHGRVAGAEALIRWNHPTLGFLQPAHFLSVAEDAGLESVLGAWVLQTAAAQLAEWDHALDPPLESISINLSASQLADPEFPRFVALTIERAGLAAHRLCLEVTETAMLDGGGRGPLGPMTMRLRALADLGVKLAIDDFGTGYSSLSHVRDFPVDYLKIDRSFVADVTTSDAAAGICAAVIALGHTTGKRIVAEGVESADQLQVLAQLGADLAQGFHVGAPAPAADFGS